MRKVMSFFFFLAWDPQASVSITAKTRTFGHTVLGKPKGSPARRHSRHSCHMFVCIVVCACSRHALDIKMVAGRIFGKNRAILSGDLFSEEEFREKHYFSTTLFPLIGCGVDS